MRKAPIKKLVFVIDEHGRTLNKESLHKLISELFDKALDEPNVDAVVLNGGKANECVYLADQVIGRDIDEWEVIYLHGSKYPAVLLSDECKERLLTLLSDSEESKGTSAEVIYKILADSRAFSRFD